MKKLIFAVVAVLGMSASMAVSAHDVGEGVYQDTFSHNIEHIYNPSAR